MDNFENIVRNFEDFLSDYNIDVYAEVIKSGAQSVKLFCDLIEININELKLRLKLKQIQVAANNIFDENLKITFGMPEVSEKHDDEIEFSFVVHFEEKSPAPIQDAEKKIFRLCPHCMQAIESREGPQAVKKLYEEGVCDWCGDEGEEFYTFEEDDELTEDSVTSLGFSLDPPEYDEPVFYSDFSHKNFDPFDEDYPAWEDDSGKIGSFDEIYQDFIKRYDFKRIDVNEVPQEIQEYYDRTGEGIWFKYNNPAASSPIDNYIVVDKYDGNPDHPKDPWELINHDYPDRYDVEEMLENCGYKKFSEEEIWNKWENKY